MPASSMSQVLQHLRSITLAEGDLPDAQLLDRFLAGRDEAAFATLVRRHGPMVLGVCRRILNNVHDVEDAFQATFLVLVRKARSIRQRETIGGFLYGVAYKTALKAREANTLRRSKERQAGQMLRRDVEDSDLELRTLLDRELSELPEKYRVPIVLCDLEGQTRKAAANQLGWPEGTLSGRLARARALLAKRLSRRGLVLPGGMAALGMSLDQASACIPPSLLASTVKAAGFLAAGSMTAGAIPAEVVTLVNGVLKSMLLTKLKTAMAVLLLVGLLGGGGLLVPLAFSEPPAEKQSDAKHEDTTQPRGHDEKQQVRTDRYGDPLPPGAIARLGTIRWRLPRFGVDCIAVPDGKTLVTANPLGGISVWDSATGKIIRQIPSDGEPRPEWLSKDRQWTTEQLGASQRSTALSADGRTAVFATPDGILYLVDIATGKVRQRCRGHRGIIQEAALSCDGKILASRSEDGTLRIWDTASGKEMRRLGMAKQQWVQYQPAHLALAADGKTVAWVGTEAEFPIHVYDISRGEEKHRLLENPGGDREVAFSPRGDLLLATCAQGPDQLWDVQTGRPVRTLPHKPVMHPSAAAFTTDGSRLALAVPGAGLRLYEVGSGKAICRIDSTWQSTEPEILAFAPDGKTLFAKLAKGPSWVLRRYDAQTGKHLAALEEARSNCDAVAFASDDRSLYTLNWDKQLWTWNASTGAPVRQTAIPYYGGCDFSADGRYLAFTDQDWMVRCCQLDTGKELWRQRTPSGRRSWRLAFSAGGASLAVSEWGDSTNGGHRIVFRSAASCVEQGQINALDQPAFDPLFSPDGRSLVWLAEDAKQPGCWMIHFRQWPTGRKLRESLRWPPGPLPPLAFSPDGRTLALPGPDWKTLDFWECAGWKKRLELPPATVFPCPLAFSPDGLLFIVGDSDGAVRIFDAHTGRLLRRQEGHRAAVTRLAFSHDGRKLVTVSRDTTALVWDISDLLQLLGRQKDEILTAELQSLWEDLASDDAAKSYQTIGGLARSGKQVLPWLRKHLQPVAAADPRLLAQLLADLDDDRFQVREKAATRLAEMGELARPALRKALTGQPSPELRRHAEYILSKAEELSPCRLRIVRSVEVVEMIGGTDAESLLKEWAKGADEAILTREAKTAMDRLIRRRTSQP